MRRPGRLARPAGLRTVTSMRVALVGRISHSAAADAWLSTAPGPAASTAAMRRPLTVSTGCPTAYDAAVNAMQPSACARAHRLDGAAPSAAS